MFVRLLVSLVLVAALWAPAGADDAGALLAKHKAFVGWTFGDGSISSLRLEGTIAGPDTKPQDNSSFRDVYRGLVERRTVQRAHGFGYDGGFTGSTFWQSTQNGFIARVIGDPAKFQVSRQLLFAEATSQLVGTLVGRKDIGGRSYPVVRVQLGDKSFPIDLYVDESAGAYARAVIDPAGAYEATYDILAYKEALPGKKVIARWRIDNAKSVFESTKIAANEQIANDDLNPPPASARWAFANDQPFPIHVSDKRIFVRAKVNGVEGSFILDTGASSIALSADFARRARLAEVSRSQALGIGGGIRTDWQRAEGIEIGGNTLSNVVVTTGIGEIGSDEGKDGLLGYDFLAGAIVEVDLDKQRMTIYDPAKVAPNKESGISVVVDLTSGHPEVPMKLNGKIDLNATWDTGNPVYVLFSGDLVHKYGLRFLVDTTRLGSQLLMRGVGNNYSLAECGTLDEIKLANITYAAPPACKLTGDISDRYVLVGFDFLKNFNYVFDYPDSMIVLQPRKL